MPTGPPQVITAPGISSPPNGLLRSAVVIDHADEREIRGTLEFSPDPCINASIFDACVGGPTIQTFVDGSATKDSTNFTSATAGFTGDDVGKVISSAATANATYTDGVENSTTTLTSATAAFTSDDVGKGITGTNIPGGTTIASVTNATTIIMSAAATATASGITFTITARQVIRTGTVIQSVTNATTVVLSPAAAATAAGMTFNIVGRDAGGNRGAKIAYTPFVVETYDACSTFGFEAAEYEARARRALLARESAAVETEFWTGALSATNPHLAKIAGTNGPNATTLAGGAPQGLRTGLALLDQAAATSPAGNAMIHARPFLVDLWVGLQLAEVRSDGKIYTPRGSIVVPGDGYPGTGPSGQAISATSEWAFVSDPVVVHRGPVAIFGGGVNAQSVDRTINEVITFAERLEAPLFNGCLLAAVQINPTVTGVT